MKRLMFKPSGDEGEVTFYLFFSFLSKCIDLLYYPFFQKLSTIFLNKSLITIMATGLK